MLSWDEFHQEDNLAPVSKAKIEQPSVTSEFQPSKLASIQMIPKAKPAAYQATLDAADEKNNADALQLAT